MRFFVSVFRVYILLRCRVSSATVSSFVVHSVVLPSICVSFFHLISHSLVAFFFYRFLNSFRYSIYYYHLNINVVGYNSVGFIILCTEWTVHIEHSYHSLIYYTYVSISLHSTRSLALSLFFLHLFSNFRYWLALEIGETLSMVHARAYIHSNYSSNKNTGNISEKSEIKK